MVKKKVKVDCQISSLLSLEESVKGHFLEYNAPCDCFLNFYDEDNRESVVYQTNFYTQQKQKSKSILSVKGK